MLDRQRVSRESCRITFGPDCSGGRNFLYQHGRISFVEPGVGTCDVHRKNGRSRPTERGRLKPFIHIDQQLPDDLNHHHLPLRLEKSRLLFLTQEMSVGRASAEGKGDSDNHA